MSTKIKTNTIAMLLLKRGSMTLEALHKAYEKKRDVQVSIVKFAQAIKEMAAENQLNILSYRNPNSETWSMFILALGTEIISPMKEEDEEAGDNSDLDKMLGAEEVVLNPEWFDGYAVVTEEDTEVGRAIEYFATAENALGGYHAAGAQHKFAQVVALVPITVQTTLTLERRPEEEFNLDLPEESSHQVQAETPSSAVLPSTLAPSAG